jgi:transcriptional regulator with XRE-family HTH domain
MQERRERLLISRARAARRAGISPARWSQIENGYESKGGVIIPANPGRVTVYRIAEALNWPLADALHTAGFEPGDLPPVAEPHNNKAEWDSFYGRLDPEVRTRMLKLMRAVDDPRFDVDLPAAA